MDKSIAVIIGSGASGDCIRWRARQHGMMKELSVSGLDANAAGLPITNDLFRPSGSALARTLLKKYPGVETIAWHLISRYAQAQQCGKHFNLEAYLRKILTYKHDSSLIKNIRQIPFYLREFIGTAGAEIEREYSLTAYIDLVDFLAKSDYKKIVLLTLNWDLLLDGALEKRIHWKKKNKNNLSAYLDIQDRWHYIKMHGSVDWVKSFAKDEMMKQIKSGDLLDALTSFDPVQMPQMRRMPVELHEGNYGFDLKEGSFGGRCLYPVMVLPHDVKSYVCPEEHIQKAQDTFKKCEDYLIVGNSLMDEDLIKILKDSTQKAKRVAVVDVERPFAEKDFDEMLVGRISGCFPSASDVFFHNIGFDNFTYELAAYDHGDISIYSEHFAKEKKSQIETAKSQDEAERSKKKPVS